MTHTKHRKRRERAEREEADRRVAAVPGWAELRQVLAMPIPPDDPWWRSTSGRAG